MINDDNLCVLVIVKKPLLALRYQLADGNVWALPILSMSVKVAHHMNLDSEDPNELPACVRMRCCLE